MGLFLFDVIMYFLTIGFYPKYRDRLYMLEDLDPALPASLAGQEYTEYSEPPTFSGLPYRLVNSKLNLPTFTRDEKDESFRAQQAEEWNKISTAISVITATSAAALAIQDISGAKAHWMVNTLYCSALGVSLEGLILTYYLTITFGGACDETVGKMARGTWKVLGIPIPRLLPTIGMACPVLYATYSAGFLLAGTAVMVMLAPAVEDQVPPNPYFFLPLIPIVYGYMCMAVVIAVTELGFLTTYYPNKWRAEKAEASGESQVSGGK